MRPCTPNPIPNRSPNPNPDPNPNPIPKPNPNFTEAAEHEALHAVLGDDERDGRHVGERLG